MLKELKFDRNIIIRLSEKRTDLALEETGDDWWVALAGEGD